MLSSPVVAHAGTDRCPGSLAVHEAEDGGLVRVRVPGGRLTARALGALGGWACELGNGRVELTARGNLQLRGLAAGAEVELAGRLAGYGLLPSAEHDTARNVLASPLSGRDGLGVLDVRSLVTELDRRLCASGELAELPGRFLFALDDGRGDVAGLGADVAVMARPGGWLALLLGGRDTGVRVPAGAGVTALLASASAFLRRRADRLVWRVTELPDGPLSLLAEIVAALGPAVRRVPATATVVASADERGPVGRIDQTDGRVALAVSVPLGELTPARCRLVAAVADREVVLTPWRGVVVPDLPSTATGAVADRLTDAGLVADPASPALGVSACTGWPGCAKALADVRADASVPLPASGSPVHWSGCSRRCGRPAGSVVDVLAGQDGYQVMRGDESVVHGASAADARAAATLARSRR